MLRPVILAGGTGTRLWPLSRGAYPKQFHHLLGDDSLFQATMKRIDEIGACSPAIVIANEEHRFIVAEQLRLIERSVDSILLEPCPRSTAPAVALAAFHALREKEGQDAVLLVLSSDHHIQDINCFTRAIINGLPAAEAGKLVIFGIEPTRPETGYGYIQKAQASSTHPSTLTEGGAISVVQFVEKPNLELAQQYLASGSYLWNSGIFLFKASAYLQALQSFEPDIYEKAQLAYLQSKQDGDFLRPCPSHFAACPSNSIDYAVMEKTTDAMVVPFRGGWSDIGSWSSLAEQRLKSQNAPQSSLGVVQVGDVIAKDCENVYLHSEHRLIAALGLKNIVVVETKDAVLVMDKNRSEEVKDIVSLIKAKNRKESDMHTRVNRPWGAFESIDNGERFQVKRITVDVGARLSLQLHHHRSEHWVVVTGTAKVTCGDDVFILHENESTYIPVETRHRLENVGNVPLEIIEIQSGSYLGEDDIVRLDDAYGRVKDVEPAR